MNYLLAMNSYLRDLQCNPSSTDFLRIKNTCSAIEKKNNVNIENETRLIYLVGWFDPQ